jgi:RHS repeat-associated protein
MSKKRHTKKAQIKAIPSFDALGNLLEDDRAAYAWDADIHLLSVAPKDGSASAAYRYDALHRRVARLEGSATLTYFVHDGWNVVAEYAGSPGSAALAHEVRHVWGEDLGGGLQTAGGVGGLLASVRASGANWAHYDGNGNVVLLTDGSGAASARYAYDAFGKLKSSSGPAAEANRYRFSTKPQERAAALSYYGYRYYAPSQGRWLSRDPLEEEGGVNLYAFVRNHTLNTVDLLGLIMVDVYVWESSISHTSPGHVMMTLNDSDLVLTSQFPHAPNSNSSMDGPNTKFTFGQTFQAEGRDPDSVYTIEVTDDEAFWNEVDRQTNMPKWNWNPDNKKETQCSIAAWNAIVAGGIEGFNLRDQAT